MNQKGNARGAPGQQAGSAEHHDAQRDKQGAGDQRLDIFIPAVVRDGVCGRGNVSVGGRKTHAVWAADSALSLSEQVAPPQPWMMACGKACGMVSKPVSGS